MEWGVIEKPKVIIKTYKGSQESALGDFKYDSTKMETEGYFPTSQSWARGSYGCGSFIVALLLCLVIIGFLIFIYMLIVKPDGILSVTYELQEVSAVVKNVNPSDEKICPMCAENVKSAAKICRYCGNNF